MTWQLNMWRRKDKCTWSISAISSTTKIARKRTKQCREEGLHVPQFFKRTAINYSVFSLRFYTSQLQKKLPNINIASLVGQTNALRLHKNLRTEVLYRQTGSGHNFCVNVELLADAEWKLDLCLLSTLAGILFETLAENSVFMFHIVFWLSPKSKGPAKSTGFSEILVAFEGSDEEVLQEAALPLPGVAVKRVVVVYTNNLFTSLSTHWNSIDRSIPSINITIWLEY